MAITENFHLTITPDSTGERVERIDVRTIAQLVILHADGTMKIETIRETWCAEEPVTHSLNLDDLLGESIAKAQEGFTDAWWYKEYKTDLCGNITPAQADNDEAITVAIGDAIGEYLDVILDPEISEEELNHEEPVIFARGNEESFIAILDALADIYGVTDEFVVYSATEQGAVPKDPEFDSGAPSEDLTHDLRVILEHFRPYGYKWEYNDQADDRYSGYDKYGVGFDVNREQTSARERGEARRKLRTILADVNIDPKDLALFANSQTIDEEVCQPREIHHE